MSSPHELASGEDKRSVPASSPLDSPARLEALHRTGLLDSVRDEAFDRLTEMARRFIRTPVSLLTLVDVDRQFFKSDQGLPEPWASQRQTPLSHSFCQHIVTRQEPLIVQDARTHPLVQDNPAISDLGIIAYLGVPLVTPEGHMLGSLCVIDHTPRAWEDHEVDTLSQLAALAMTEIALQQQLREKEQSAERLRESEAAYRAFFEQAGVGKAEIDLPTGCFRRVNQKLCEITGYSAAELSTIRYASLVHPDEVERVRAEWQAAQIVQQQDHLLEHRIVPKEGNPCWIQANITILEQSADRPPCAVVTLVDVTTRKEAALQLAYQAYLLDNIYDAVIASDPDFRITLWSRGAERMYGWSADEAKGHPIRQLIGSGLTDEQRAVAIRELYKTDSNRLELITHHKDGTPIETEAFTVVLRGPDGEIAGHLGINRDISERKRYQRALEAMNESLDRRVAERTAELERSNRELNQFTYIASHDLKAPLRAIEHLARWIEEDAGHLLPPPSQEHLAKLISRVGRMETLLEDLLAYSRAGRMQYQNEAVQLKSLIESVISRLSPPPGFTFTLSEPMPILTTPRAPLETVLRNLLSNAIKHHHQPEIGSVHVSAQSEGRWATISVTDNGPGIAPTYHERIFEIFQTLLPRDQVEGSGMGLAIVKKIVERYGGSVQVESTPGEGATFRITWPLTAEDSGYHSDSSVNVSG